MLNNWFSKHFPRFFLRPRDIKLLETRIETFENQTGCEVVFHFCRTLGPNPIEQTKSLFYKFGLEKTIDRAGILIAVSTRDRQIGIWVDEGITRKSENVLWTEVVKIISENLKKDERLQALIKGLDHCEPVLAKEHVKHPEGSKVDELPNKPIY